MDPREYFMMEVWPTLDDEQKMMFAELIAMLSQYSPETGHEYDRQNEAEKLE